MRRLIAYILACVSILLGIGFNFTNVVNQTNPNYEYDTGREYTYRLEYKDDDYQAETETELAELQAGVRETMEERLSLYGISKYQIAEEGDDILRVKFKQENDTEYTRVAAFLQYDADFTVALGDPDNALTLEGADIFSGARIEYIADSPIPVILLDLKDKNASSELEDLIDEALAIQEEKAPGAESELAPEATIVIWSDYDEDHDDYLIAKEGSDAEMQAKIFMTFDPRYAWYEDSEVEHSSLALYLNIGEADSETGTYEKSNIAKANKDALYLTNLFNASDFNANDENPDNDFTVELLFANTVPASIEPLFNFDIPLSIEWSNTLIAFLVGLAVIALILAFINRLAALHIVTSSLLTSFLTLLLYNIVGVSFSSSSVVGLVLILLISFGAGILYHHAFKNEVYRGRSFKKANQEATKKTDGPIVDSFIVTLIVGLVTYFLGGPSLQGFSTIAIFGSIIGLITTLLLNKGLFWLFANNVGTAKNYGLYGINEDKVNAAFDKKAASYEGPVANINVKKPLKPLAIGGGILSIATLILTLVFSFTPTPVVNRAAESETYTRIYLTVNTDNTPISTVSNNSANRPADILALITYEDEALAYESIEYEYNTVREGEGLDEINVNKTYYIMNFNEDLEPTTEVIYGGTPTILSTALIDAFETSDPNAEISVNPVSTTSASPNLNEIFLSAGIALLAISVYFIFRYGFSRATAFLGVGLGTGLISLGLFVMTRIAVTPIALTSVILAINFSAIFASYLFGFIKREKKDNPELTFKEASTIGARQSATAITLLGIISLVLALNFFGLGPSSTMYLYLGLFVGVILSWVAITYLTVPLENLVRRLIAKLPKIERKKKTPQKKNIEKRQKSAEPEEAIIIGIND